MDTMRLVDLDFLKEDGSRLSGLIAAILGIQGGGILFRWSKALSSKEK